jgi:Fe-S cluster biogenesis protein NfuA
MTAPPDEVQRILREVIEPLIRADGGEVFLVSATPDEVHLHLGGSFSGCPGNTLARRRVLEPAVQSVAPNTRVKVTSGPIVPDGSERLGPASAPPPDQADATGAVADR